MIHSFIKTLTFSVCCMWLCAAEAQTADTVRHVRVKQVIAGQQYGLGTWLYYEWRMADQITLRGELGGGGFYHLSNPGAMFAPANIFLSAHVTVESRWYYNLDRRMRRSKDITDNSGNFIGLKVGYSFNFPPFVFAYIHSNETPLFLYSYAVPVLFTWGIQRNLGRHRHFNYEVGFQAGCWIAPYRVFPYLSPHLRIAYRLY